MAESLAFWFNDHTTDNSDQNKLPELELHINFWSIDSKELDYLDIGVQITPVEDEQYGSINVYLPFSINEDNYIPTLGETVCNDKELISAIFNSTVTTTKSNSKNDVFEIEFLSGSKLNFYTQILPTTDKNDSSDIGVNIKEFKSSGSSSRSSGTIIEFPQKLFNSSSLQNAPTYFRFRIKLDSQSKKVIGPESKDKSAIVTNYFESTEMVDFRINEPRNLPAKIRAKLNEKLKLKAIHFFLIRNALSEFKMSHSKYKRCRLLEDNIWKGYLKPSDREIKAPKQMLIYHWAKKVGDAKDEKPIKYIDHFSAFAKFTKRKVGIWKIIGAVIVILVLGVVSGILATYLWTNIIKEVESGQRVNYVIENKVNSEVTSNATSTNFNLNCVINDEMR